MATPGRILRTVRHLKPRQALAQLRHMVAGSITPVPLDGVAPQLAGISVAAPFLPPARHADFDGSHRLRLLNRELVFEGEIDWNWGEGGPLFAYHLHQFEYLRRPSLAPRVRAALISDWIDAHRCGVGWEPHPTSLRIFSWGKLLLTEGALELDEPGEERVRNSLACQIETLSRHLEVRLQANHLLSNLLAVVFGGLLFAGGRADVWMRFGTQLRRELSQQILPDGGHEERSPMYHSLLLENLLDVLNIARVREDRVPPQLLAQTEDCVASMLGALHLWTHPDGEIALFADSAQGIAQPPVALADYASALGVEARHPASPGLLEACGYVRLEEGPFCLIASVSGPAPPHQPGHSHCDALAFELSVGSQRVVTDTGVAEYIPGALRDVSRSTRSHATLEVAGREQAEIWQGHRIGGRPEVRLCRVVPGVAAEATCSGWATPETIHRRRFSVGEGAVSVHDRVEGRLRPVRFALPLAPGLQPHLESESDGRAHVIVPLDRGDRLRIALPGAGELRWRVERLPYFPEFGCQRDRACLVGQAESFREGAWRFQIE